VYSWEISNLIGTHTQALRDGSGIRNVANWSWTLCAAALGIIPGETYRKPQATSNKQQAASEKLKAKNKA